MRSIRLVDDTELWLHDDEDLSNAIARSGDYWERDILDYLADKHPQQEIILDIGANVGNHTAYFAQYLEYYYIIAYEPVPENYALLQLNTRRFASIERRQEAVGAERGWIQMQRNTRNMGAGEVNPLGDLRVQQVRIDDLIIKQQVTLIKLDVEWSERGVLEGATNILKEDKPLILIEDVKEEYMGLLNNLGYQLEVVWPEHKTYLYRSKDA